MDNYFKLANSIIREHAHLEAPKLEIKLAGKPFTKITPKGGNKTIVSVAGGEPMSISLPMQKVIEIGKDVGLWDGEKVNTKAISGPDAWDTFDYEVMIAGGKIMVEEEEIRSLDGFFADEEVEDQETKTDMASVEKGLGDLAATAGSGAKGLAAKLLGSKAQAAKAALDKRAKAVAAAIPAYNEYTKELETAYKNLKKQ